MSGDLAVKAWVLTAFMTTSVVAESYAAQISVPNVAGTGTFTNNTSLLIDGSIPPEGTVWTNPTNVYWSSTVPTFTLDFGSVYTLDDLLIQVDNNDDYRIDYSLNGSGWSTLYTIPIGLGNINNGMDTFTQSDINFTPVNARYLRISATGGDDKYAVSEIQAFGTSVVPEPGTITLLGSGLLLGQVFRRRKQSAFCE